MISATAGSPSGAVERFDMGSTPRHSVSVAGVVVRDDGVLELAETFDEGVRREVAEETGVHVEVEQLTGAG
jgi:8-oxo-dGTP diphosphatase